MPGRKVIYLLCVHSKLASSLTKLKKESLGILGHRMGNKMLLVVNVETVAV